MVLTRAQLAELAEEFLNFRDFIEKYDILYSELLVSKNCNSLILNRIINLKMNALNNVQYIRREMLEVNPVPQSISNNELEQSVCCALSLTGTTVKPNDIHFCYRMNNKEKVIIKFQDRKQRNEVVFKRKQLKSKNGRATGVTIWTVAVYK